VSLWLWVWPWMRPGTGATLRLAAMADSARMAAIHAEGFAVGWDCETIEHMLLAGDIADVLVSQGVFGQIVTGFALSRVVLDEAELLSIALDPEVRGRGFSARLLLRHAERVRRAGAQSLFLEVAADNAPALALYRGLGMQEIGRRKGYYPASGGSGTPRRDALTMRWDIAHLDPAPRPW
jgi:[ribosomal protein S18]-alanine N-acetyltransferase